MLILIFAWLLNSFKLSHRKGDNGRLTDSSCELKTVLWVVISCPYFCALGPLEVCVKITKTWASLPHLGDAKEMEMQNEFL